jgi:hypothetical protein
MRSDVDSVDRDITAALQLLRDRLPFPEGSEQETALNEIETFCAIAIRVFRKTNPSKLRSESRNVEVQAYLDGVPVIRGAA